MGEVMKNSDLEKAAETRPAEKRAPDFSGELPIIILKLRAISNLLIMHSVDAIFEMDADGLSGLGLLLSDINGDLSLVNEGLYGD
jgi:hypothetical protein